MAPMDHLRSKHGYGRIAVTAAALGVLAGAHAVALVTTHSALTRQWAAYVVAMCSFHFCEFMWACANDPVSVSWDAFLLNHSPQYHAAVAAGVAEFALGALLAPAAKAAFPAVALGGGALVVGGQALRAAAMWHAGRSFTHLVAEERREDHALVTTGVYSVLRHPAYTGWFWWSVGTQLLLANPLCAVAYALAARTFFAARIPHEEERLVSFFGRRYVTYARGTWVCIPGVVAYVDGLGDGDGGSGDGGGAGAIAGGAPRVAGPSVGGPAGEAASRDGAGARVPAPRRAGVSADD